MPFLFILLLPRITRSSKKFLTAGINVYVDKPVSEDLLEVDELYKLAEQHDVQLTAGFNRRFAPYNQQIRQITGKQLITVEKNTCLSSPACSRGNIRPLHPRR
ncbi:Gfo/Idh/MocA family oxidoreductase [Amylolactobacillus amylophilus]|uniref:Gfo/Idh/MocA family oxidoreductase n=1 Tax=Amylolactobacillus amylophilus TaxID=1603 RepID=UPI0034E19FCE